MSDNYSEHDPLELDEESAFGVYAMPEEAAPAITAPASEPQKAATAAEEASKVKVRPRYDKHLWGTFLFLILFSLVELFSASSQEVKIGNIYGPVIRHAMFLAIGLAIAFFLQKVHFKYFYRYIPVFVTGSLMLMTFVLFGGVRINGTMRGFQLGPVTILPADVLKLATVLGVALILSKNQVKGRRDVTRRGTIMAAGLVLVSSALLVTQGLSNAILVMSMSLAMMLIGGMRWKKFGIVVATFAVLGLTAFGLKDVIHGKAEVTEAQLEIARLNHEPPPTEGASTDRSGTWKQRLERHFRSDKYDDPITEENRQEQFSYIAQAHGGLRGVGIGNSRENSRLPLAFSDYIFAIIIEEWGLVFGLFIMLCYLWMLARAARIGVKCTSTFACLTVCGCAVFVVSQALYHMAIVSGVLPVSGQPLPLISKGGTSILVTCTAIGCMLSVSAHAAFKGDMVAKKHEFAALPESLRNENPSQL